MLNNKVTIGIVSTILGIVAGLLGMYTFMEVASLLGRYTFMEGKIEKRVTYQAEVTELRADIESVREKYTELQGKIWTLEQTLSGIDKAHAVHMKGHQ
jgi:uncharacterized protein YlxW (UPF0749 family)